MEKKLLHTPVGVRDIYGEECAKKLHIQSKIHNILSGYGYRDIQTPAFEFFDIFSKEKGSVLSKNMYKFFDREGNTLVLRPDMTPSIARAASKYYMDEDMPIRFCYEADSFINHSEYQGKLKQFTQEGAELIGDNTSDADAEIVVMVIDAMLASGLREFQIEIGQVDFFKGIVEETGIDEETQEKLHELIEIKNYFGVEELISNTDISDDKKKVFLSFSELFGSLDMLDKAAKLTGNKKALKALERLVKLYHILEEYGYEKYVSFDLGMLSKFHYYTGVILKAYTYGTGDAIVTGGRYDSLIKQYGKSAPAIGFAINVDQLMVALSRQKIEVEVDYSNSMVLYKTVHQKQAISFATAMRNKGHKIVLMRKRSSISEDQYKEYALRMGIDKVYTIISPDKMRVDDYTNDTSEEKSIGTEE